MFCIVLLKLPFFLTVHVFGSELGTKERWGKGMMRCPVESEG